jgi:4-diphosphocytidyl-2-C-methyl-D-erythritol kinase
MILGRGETVREVRGFPPCGVALANPGVPLSTEKVYAALKARPLAASPPSVAEPPDFAGDFAKLIDYAERRGNDLEAPASRLVPAIGEVLAALRALPGARLARLSGSGPTCFALFATEGEAEQGAARLAEAHPSWWIAASRLAA